MTLSLEVFIDNKMSLVCAAEGASMLNKMTDILQYSMWVAVAVVGCTKNMI
jgi:hypothetical protein